MNLWACFTKCSLIFKSRCLLILETRCNAVSFLFLCWLMEIFCEKKTNNAITYFNLLLLDNIKNAQKIHGLFTNLHSSRSNKKCCFLARIINHNFVSIISTNIENCVNFVLNQALISPFTLYTMTKWIHHDVSSKLNNVVALLCA